MFYSKPIFHLMGDRGLLVELGDRISPAVNQGVQRLLNALDLHALEGVLELVPSYRSLLVIYDPLSTSLAELKNRIIDLHAASDQFPLPNPRVYNIPVVYGGEYGPDLEWVADYHHITPEEVIALHTEKRYCVYMIGFMPGFPYLGELADALATPRRETPRTKVPRGSVAIAQKQTGIYPVDSPGGWQIIGWTPLKLFDPNRQPPSLLAMGDQVQFHVIAAEEASRWLP